MPKVAASAAVPPVIVAFHQRLGTGVDIEQHPPVDEWAPGETQAPVRVQDGIVVPVPARHKVTRPVVNPDELTTTLAAPADQEDPPSLVREQPGDPAKAPVFHAPGGRPVWSYRPHGPVQAVRAFHYGDLAVLVHHRVHDPVGRPDLHAGRGR